MNAANNLNNGLIERVREVWRSRGRDLSDLEARQIDANITGFFKVLAEWSQAEVPSGAGDPGNRLRDVPTLAQLARGVSSTSK